MQPSRRPGNRWRDCRAADGGSGAGGPVAVPGVAGADSGGLGAAPAPAGGARARGAPSGPRLSWGRVGAAWAQPPPRRVVPAPSLDVPTFRVEVTTQDLWNPASLDEPAFDPTWGLPSAGDLLMGGISKIGS